MIIIMSYMTANCGDPSPPSNGYLEPYTSTTEGARVNIVHVHQNGQLAVEEIVCSSDGQWEVSACSGITNMDSKPTVKLLAGISGSLGSLLAVALLVCGILIVIIAIGKQKGV